MARRSHLDAAAATTDGAPLAAGLPSLRCLSLSGCHLEDSVLADVLGRWATCAGGECALEYLDLSYSTVKAGALGCVAETCGRLVELNVSGIFRLRRLPDSLLLSLVLHCPALKRLVALDCPDVGAKTWKACEALNPRLAVVCDETVPSPEEVGSPVSPVSSRVGAVDEVATAAVAYGEGSGERGMEGRESSARSGRLSWAMFPEVLIA
ncbi:hypothetical protein DFJ73DRAFT_255517 [Zopfochytrium polystomum]|nr:hypothetical protein DFJ73DRAFT_255517 [Zopfochytrium polystomum]